jgi:hypothetical protein
VGWKRAERMEVRDSLLSPFRLYSTGHRDGVLCIFSCVPFACAAGSRFLDCVWSCFVGYHLRLTKI